MRALWAVLAALVLATGAHGESGPLVEVDFNNPGLSPAHWILTLYPDGTGHFRSESGPREVPAPGNWQEKESTILQTPDLDRDIRVSAEFAARVFSAARRHGLFSEQCESRMKVAFQGWKTLEYRGPEGQGSCRFNYSRDKEIQELGDSMLAVAGTILEGARLEMLLQHDRLGLDREMEYLLEAAGDGRVQQLGSIRSILERLAGDESVMARVRKRARELLAHATG